MSQRSYRRLPGGNGYLLKFIEECCIVEEGRKVSNRSIRYAYETWCRENGDYPLGQKLFNAKMTERGFAVKRSGANGSRDWHGIGLRMRGYFCDYWRLTASDVNSVNFYIYFFLCEICEKESVRVSSSVNSQYPDLEGGEVKSLQQSIKTTGWQRRMKNADSNGVLTPDHIYKKILRKWRIKHEIIADLVHEKKQLVEKAEAILNEAEKAGGSWQGTGATV